MACCAAPRLTIAAAGTGAGWRRAALLLSTDDGVQLGRRRARPRAPAVIGTVEAPPGPGCAALADLAGTRRGRAGACGHGARRGRRRGARSRAPTWRWSGDELLQFGRAEPLGANRWRLSRLWRGRRGTEGAIGTPGRGRSLRAGRGGRRSGRSTLPGGDRRDVRVLASGAGDDAAVAATAALDGASVATAIDRAARLGARCAGRRRSCAGCGAAGPAGAGATEPTRRSARRRERYRVTVARRRRGRRDRNGRDAAAANRAARRRRVTVRQAGTLGDSPGATIVVPA